MSNWPQLTKDLSALLQNLRGGAPEVMKAFAGMAQAASASNALVAKTKELIALSIAVAVRCLSEDFRAFTSALIPHDDIDQVQCAETRQKAKE